MRIMNFSWIFFLFCVLSWAQPIRILVVTGGHSFNETAFFGMFRSMDGITFDTISQPYANQRWSSSLAKCYDAIVFYDMTSEIPEKSKAGFIEMCETGIPLLFLHHSLCSYQNWSEYKKIIGGKYFLEPPPGKTTASSYKHDITLEIFPVGPPHPIVAKTIGSKNAFLLTDEGYSDIEVLPDVTPFLMTSHPDCFPLIGWAHQYRNSPVLYIMPGHDEMSFTNPFYISLIRNSILWLAEQKKIQSNELQH